MIRSDQQLWKEIEDLIGEAKLIEAELPVQSAAGRIMIFPKLLRTLELVVRHHTSGANHEIQVARRRLHEAVRMFNSLMFGIQHDVGDWRLGEKETQQIGRALRDIIVAARELEDLVKERRQP